MKLYFLATNAGCAEFLFADDEQRAIEIFSIYAVLARFRPSRFWCRQVAPQSLPRPSRQQLEDALASAIKGFGRVDQQGGWCIQSVQNKFDRLTAVQDEGSSS